MLFRSYSFTENFMLPLSHDEVVHGKGSLLSRMPGDEWQMFANLRLLFAYMFVHPGTKLVFMGGEFGQYQEWNHDQSLHWELLDRPLHRGILTLIKMLNKLYREEPALYRFGFEQRGFEWIDYADRENSVIAFRRLSDKPEEQLVVVLNFTPVVRNQYRIGVPAPGVWNQIFCSDAIEFGGSGISNDSCATTEDPIHGQAQSVALTLPPLAVSVFKHQPN